MAGTIRKRGNGQGSVRQLPSRKWRWEVMLDGRRYSGTAGSKTLAQQALAGHIADATRGGVVDPSTVTVGEYLERWLEGRKASRAVRTHEIQEAALKNHIKPVLGGKRLQKLSPADLQYLFDGLNVQVGERGPLGAASQRHVHQLLLTALRDAQRVELVTRNVAEFVRPNPPRKRDEEEDLDAYTPEEAAKFLAAARQDHRGAVFEFLLATGMRRGEVCGLRWMDVNWEQRTVSIRENVIKAGKKDPLTSTPKTAGSRRVVHLSRAAQALLRQVQAQQDTARLAMGEKWRESGRVFVDIYGQTLHPSNLKRDMKRVYTAAGVRHLTVHGLRHTYASLSLRRGVPVEVVSKQLGHSTVAFTLSLYRTVYQQERAGWALDLDDLVRDTPD